MQAARQIDALNELRLQFERTDERFDLNVNESNILRYSMTQLQYRLQDQQCGVFE